VAAFLNRYHQVRVIPKQGWDDDISAVLFRLPGSGTIVVGVNAAHSPGRRNFSLAHELGHLVLGHRGYSVQSRHPGVEREADRFATEFLLPERLLGAWCQQFEVRAPGRLAQRIGLSRAMVERRFVELGLAWPDSAG
jgi:Zn-dependent peptidase ImmA (M78 family)